MPADDDDGDCNVIIIKIKMFKIYYYNFVQELRVATAMCK